MHKVPCVGSAVLAMVAFSAFVFQMEGTTPPPQNTPPSANSQRKAGDAPVKPVSPQEAKRRAEQRKVGKAWTVVFANGQKDTWTMFHKDDDNGLPIHFKNTGGEEMQINLAHGAFNVVTKQGCIMVGHLVEGKVQGQVLRGCTQPQGIRFTGTVKQ